MIEWLHQDVFLYNIGSVYWKGSKQPINESWVRCRCIGWNLVLMLVAELNIIPLDAMTMYYKDNGTKAFAKEPRSHQKSKHMEQRYT